MLKKYKKIFMAVALFFLLSSVMLLFTSSLGFFSYTKEGSIVNYVTVNGLEIDILNEEDDALNLINSYPMYDHEGMEQVPFTFTITNKSSKAIDYTLLVENDALKQAECVLEDNVTPCSALSTSDIRYSYKLNNRDYSAPANLGTNNNVIFSNTIQGNTTVTVSVKLWIKHDATNDIQGQVFFGKLILQGDRSTGERTYANFDDILDTFTVDDEEALMCDNTNNTLSNCALYDTIEQAIASRNTGAIVLLNDISRSSTIEFASNKDIKLDLNGKSITLTGNGVKIRSLGNLTINDSAGGSRVISEDQTLNNSGTGTLTVNGGYYERTANVYAAVYNEGEGTIILNDGKFVSTGTCVQNRASNRTGGTIYIAGGTYKSSARFIIENISSTGSINIIQRDKPIYMYTAAEEWKPAIKNTSTGTINITASRANACTVNASDTTTGLCVYAVGNGANDNNTGNTAVQNITTGTINVTGGTYVGGHQGFNNDNVNGIINISNVSVSAGKPLHIYTGGTINICASTVTSTLSPSQDLTFNNNSGTINYSNSVVFTDGTNTPTYSGTGTKNNTGDSCSVSYPYEAIACDDNNGVLTNCMIYDTIDDAIASRNTGTITLTKDINRTDTAVEFPAGKTMTLVMDGHKITATETHGLVNRGNLTIIGDDNSLIETLAPVGAGKRSIYSADSSNTTINGGTYISRNGHGIMNNSTGTMNLNDVYVIALKDNPSGVSWYYGVLNYSTGILNITGNTIIENKGTGAWSLFGVQQNSTAGTINIIGENAVFDVNDNYVSGIYIKTAYGSGINVSGDGIINIDGCTVESGANSAVNAYSSSTTNSRINIVKGVFKSNYYGLKNIGAAQINVSGGTFIAPTGVYNGGTGEINICEGTITATQTDLNNESTGTINYSNGVVFTSGSTPTKVDPNGLIANTGNTCGFAPVKMCDNNNGTLTNCSYYGSLDSALSSRSTGTLIFTKNVTLSEPIVVASGKNYTFDLNGKTLTYNTTDSYAIQSEGTLNLVGNGGTINGNAGAILSSGNSRLNIDGGTYGVINLSDSAVGNFVNSTHNYYAEHSACDSRICTNNNSTLVANNITSTATSNKTLLAANASTVLIKDSTLSSLPILSTSSTDTVTVEDCTINASGTSAALVNDGAGTLNIKNTSIDITNTNMAATTNKGGTLNIEGVTITSNNPSANGIRLYRGGTVNIRDCDIQVNENGIYSSDGSSGTINVYNTRVTTTDQQSIDLNGNSTINVYGGVFISNVEVLLNKGTGTFNIIQTDKPIYVKSLAQANKPAIYNNGSGIFNISTRQNANACTNTPSDTTRGLCVYADGTGDYSSDTSNTAVANGNYGTININGGTYYGGFRGIYLYGSAGNINVSNATISSRHIAVVASNSSSGTINVCGSSIKTIPVTGLTEYDIWNNSSNGATIKYTGCAFSDGSSILSKKREATSGSITNPSTCPIQ